MSVLPGSTYTDDGGGFSEPEQVHLWMAAGADRQLLAEQLQPDYQVSVDEVPTANEAVDLLVVDAGTFRRDAEAIAAEKHREELTFLPVLLIVPAGDDLSGDPSVWEYVDDVIEAPIRTVELEARVENLLQRRRTSTRLAARERALERTVEELELTQRAIDAAPVGVTITDPDRPDNPTVYANAAFERITGYDREEILGRNMRFLQGPATDEAAIAELSDAIEAEQSHTATLVNYRADGTRFWNRVDVAPVYDEDGSLTNYVGFQTDVTDETVRQQRLDVLNRVLRHNLSNDINVVLGHAENLLDVAEDPQVREGLGEIRAAAADLANLGDTTRRIERTLERSRGPVDVVDVGSTLGCICAELEAAHPDARLSLEVAGGPWQVPGNGLAASFRELVENAVVHSERETPAVEIIVGPAGEDGRVEVTIADDGPGMRRDLVEVFQSGRETQLNHGDGLGLWLVHWTVTLLGGDIAIDSTGVGTTVTMALPTADSDAVGD